MKTSNRFVPLAEISEHSDVIAFGEMGLPVGFDIDRLAANVGVLEKVAHFGNIGHLSIVGFRGDVTEEDYTVGGSYSDGTSTAVGSVSVSRAALQEHELQGGQGEHRFGYNWTNTTVKINNAEIENRIKRDGDRWDLGVYDPEARLKYMNKALVSGLQAATGESVFIEGGVLGQLAYRAVGLPFAYGVWKYLYGLSGDPLVVMTAASPALEAGLNHARNVFKEDGTLPKRQWSVLNYPQFDRYLAATTILRTGKILKLISADRSN